MARPEKSAPSKPERQAEMVLTADDVRTYLRAAAETRCEAERDIERFFLLPENAVTLRIQ